ncbi:putative periplasmic lipoprotein [Luteirhabdus pelagi]|uniref:hypothetical protein n=1 Tax=Luteirhabdus pelagi TaxID=2792783 RepID=UPI00193A57E9|nr:hypothetical protein [Luteirhabdus pelagi]
MKSIITLLLFSLFLIGCSPDQEATIEDIQELNLITEQPGGDEVLYETPLMAGQHTEAGTVTVSIVDGTVEVTYETIGDWVIDETHLFVGQLSDLPTTGSGNPKNGHFEYKGTHNGVTTVTYTTDNLNEGECAYVAAHAVVSNSSGGSETAWGQGIPIGGNNWAMMFEVCY